MRPLLCLFLSLFSTCVCCATDTWDGRYPTDEIEVTIVYFVPTDRSPLTDWRERVDYFARRIELFHNREFQGQSKLTTIVEPRPFVSASPTSSLRKGDQNAIFHRTLREVDARLGFAKTDAAEVAEKARGKFQILLVLSDINWRPLDDFYRLHPLDNREVAVGYTNSDKNGSYELDGGRVVFEGVINSGLHYPGATSGGARATYNANRGVGWGLVSADGWRVPYRGSDCVVYHEGCGHTVGLPHPEPGNGSVMGFAQYQGWLSESWIDKEQKSKLGWVPAEDIEDPNILLFTRFRALPAPAVPRPNEEVRLSLDWPEDAKVESLRVRYQTSLVSPWVEVPQAWQGEVPAYAQLGVFDRATPISYRVDAELDNGARAELWGYLQVRDEPSKNPLPFGRSSELSDRSDIGPPSEVSIATEKDLLALTDPKQEWQIGEWTRTASSKLESPKRYGARLQLPYTPPDEYQISLIVEPLDEPHGLIVGCRSGTSRFVALFNHRVGDQAKSAIENVDGRNVGNETTVTGDLFKLNRLSQVIVQIRKTGVDMFVDGKNIVHWIGKSEQLNLSDYWKTPDDSKLFIGSYDCSYRFHRITIEPL
jgi:hypothetical protein